MRQFSNDSEMGWSPGQSAPPETFDTEAAHAPCKLAQLLDLHDLGNMIQVASSAMSLLERRYSATSETQLELLFSGGREALQCASTLTRRLLDNGQLPYKDKALCTAAESVKRIARQASLLAPTGVQIETLIADVMENHTYDRVALDNALMNLVINAIHAVDGAGTIRLGAIIDIEGAAPLMRVFVEDDGKGIDDVAMRRLFAPGASSKEGGNGLGLVGVARFARAHGGEVAVTSRLGNGTCVSILLPSQPC